MLQIDMCCCFCRLPAEPLNQPDKSTAEMLDSENGEPCSNEACWRNENMIAIQLLLRLFFGACHYSFLPANVLFNKVLQGGAH